MVNPIRTRGGVLLGAVVSGALAAGTLTGAPTANPTCASFFGINNGGGCTSNITSIAIAIGTGAKATANGLFGAAFSVGTSASASTGDAFTFATSLGDNAISMSKGLFGIAAQLGPDGLTFTDGSGSLGNLGLNIALSLTPGQSTPGGSSVQAQGFGNLAVNLFGVGTALFNHEVFATGVINIATNLGGNNNKVRAGQGPGALNLAFNIFGSGNTVDAGPGPVAIAGSIAQTGQPIAKVGPGFNINGVVVGGAAAVRNAKTSAPTATAVRTGKGTASAASSVGGSKKIAAPSAASVGHKK
jgi:hypothetical protein